MRTLASIPGCLECAWSLRDWVAPGRSSRHPGRAFSNWLADLARAPQSEDSGTRVLFFACRNGWINLSLATMVALLARGAPVEFVYLPYEAMDSSDTVEQRRRFRYHYGKYLRNGLHPRLRCTDLRQVRPAALTPEGRRQAELQSLFDTRSIRLREEVDPVHDPGDRAVFEFRLRRNLDCMSRITALLAKGDYDVLITPNGTLREMGASYRAAKLAGVNVNTFEFFDRSHSIVVAHNLPAADSSADEYWQSSSEHHLSQEARSRVQDYIDTRLGVKWRGFSSTIQRAPYRGDPGAVRAQLNLPAGRRIVLLCPNIPWDSSVLGQDRAFPSHQEWVRQTVKFFSTRDDAHLIVRSHPDEMLWGSNEPLAELIAQSIGSRPELVTVIRPEDPVNTYDLMDLCDVGLVYNSTAGLEMALRGIPALVAGQPHYAAKGFTRDAASAKDYFGAVDDSLRQPPGSRLPEQQVELAWCYMDAYLFTWQKPFPWGRSSLWQDLQDWPMARVLGEEGRREFGGSFDQLLRH